MTEAPGGKTEFVHIRHTYEIPDSVIEVVIEMAGYGIAYWADEAQYDTEARKYKVHVAEDDEWWTLSYEEIAQALVLVGTRNSGNYVDKYVRETLRELEDGEQYPGGDIDSHAADVIIQLAIYGEVIYG